MSPVDPATPRTSVLIPAYNEEALLAQTIQAVHASFTALGDQSYEIVVCDNNSTDGTAAAARAHGARVVFEPHNQIAKARNTAMHAAQGVWLIFIDADTTLNVALLKATLAELGSGQICGGGSVIRFDESKMNPIASHLTRLWNGISRTLHLAAGSYVFCLREAALAIGGFDERLYASEEIAFSRGIKRWGRARGLRFRVLTASPILTSARKMEWYGQWGLARHVLKLALRPMAVRNRAACDLWYERPAGK